MNPVIELLQTLGCDLTVIPTNDFELAVLVMKFIVAFGLICIFLKFLFKVMCNMLGGKW